LPGGVNGVDPVAVADQFLARHGQHFGVTDVAAQLAPRQIEVDKLGMSHVRYEQRHGGIPVWGAELIAHVGAHGLVSTVNGRLAKKVQAGTEARVTQATAEQVAEAMFRANHPVVPDLEVKTLGLYILAPVIEDQCGCAKANGGETGTLVWVVEVLSEAVFDGDHYFVDATTGQVVKTETLVSGLDRRVRDCGPEEVYGPCYLDQPFIVGQFTYTLGRSEGNPARGPSPIPWCAGSLDVDIAYDSIASFWTYLSSRFGRNGPNGTGGVQARSYAEAVVLTDYWTPRCPSLGAWYLVTGATCYCRGYVSLEIVSHEYTHLLLDSLMGNNTGLTYANEPGAIDEAGCDFLAEAVEKFLSGYTDWNYYIPQRPEIRSLSNPSQHVSRFGQQFPATFYSGGYYCGTDDYGGVHVNSLVVSHTYYLASEGGVENGCTVTGIGLSKMEQVLYRAMDYYFTPNITFNELYQVMQQACRDLYSESDTAQLVAAMQATELDQAGACSGIPERLPYASTNQVSPQIRTQPQNQTFTAGTNVSLTVAIYGSYPLTYQWFRGGTLVSASTNVAANSVLTLTNVSAADAGDYIVIVTNAYGAATSQVATLMVKLPGQALRHRYSFDADASDSIGTAHGQLINGASLSGGAVQLNGVNQYVNLPNNLLTGYTSITLEMWVTDTGSGNWARLYDFGNSSGGEDFPLGNSTQGTQYMFLCLPSDAGNLRGAYTVTGGGSGEQVVQWAGQRPPVGQQVHIAWTSDGATHTGVLYVNGAEVGRNTALTLTPAVLGPTVNNWLGRSQWPDALFKGSIAEFRIYDTALSSNSIAANYLLGPDALSRPTQRISAQGSGVRIEVETQVGYTYTLQSATALDGTNTVWTDGPALPGNGNWQTFEQPVTNSAQFFRTRRTGP
ncbi:MAG TPA: M4 family metallopeptidase, partial [Verrucomicrobiae bacterium]